MAYQYLRTVLATPPNIALTNAVQTTAVSRTSILTSTQALAVETTLLAGGRVDSRALNTRYSLISVAY